MRIAVIDLGTNVFGVLHAEVEQGEIKRLKEYKCGTRLLEEGALTESSYASAVDALKMIFYFIESNGGADVVKAYATSALRDNDGGKEFAKRLEDFFGFEIEIISGDREAELIYRGIREAFFIWNENVLMMDIGGGSVEFIMADKEKILWKRSFPVGVSRIRDRFKAADPIKESEIEQIALWCEEELAPLKEELERYKPTLLAGSSGSFDTFRALLFPEDVGIRIGEKGFISSRELPLDRFNELHDRLMASTYEERIEMKGMTKLRAHFIVYASIFTQVVLKMSGIKDIIQSAYSLKEGGVFEQLKIDS